MMMTMMNDIDIDVQYKFDVNMWLYMSKYVI